MKYPNEVQHELLYKLINTASKTEVGLITILDQLKIMMILKIDYQL